MKRLVLLLFLCACGAQPAPEFFGAERKDVTRNGRDYVVYHTESRVEVIRLGHARNGEHQAIRADMINLIEPVTGCRPVPSTLTGDSGELRGSITC